MPTRKAEPSKAPLRFVVALPSEGAPLVEHYRLQRQRDPRSERRIYRRDNVALVVSGIGKVAVAGAIDALHQVAGEEPHAVWLNVGIAGHGVQPVGEALLAHKIVDRESGEAWYPPLTFAPPCATSEVVTVERPEIDYPEPVAYEMEAAAFCKTARRLASAELVHCLKVVSDGPDAGIEQIDRATVRRLIRSALPAIDTVARACAELAGELRSVSSEPTLFAEYTRRWHFTVSEQHELRRQLRRRQTLVPVEEPSWEGAQNARGKEINRRLRQWLDDLAMQRPLEGAGKR